MRILKVVIKNKTKQTNQQKTKTNKNNKTTAAAHLQFRAVHIPGMKELLPQGANFTFHSLRAQQISSHKESVPLIS